MVQVAQAAVPHPGRRTARSLVATLEPGFGAIKVYRPYRDIRFSPDKRPIQEHAALSATDGRGYGYHLQVSAAGLLLGGGLYQPPRERLERFGVMLDDPVSAGRVRRRLGEAERPGFELSDDGKLKAAPGVSAVIILRSAYCGTPSLRSWRPMSQQPGFPGPLVTTVSVTAGPIFEHGTNGSPATTSEMGELSADRFKDLATVNLASGRAAKGIHELRWLDVTLPPSTPPRAHW